MHEWFCVLPTCNGAPQVPKFNFNSFATVKIHMASQPIESER